MTLYPHQTVKDVVVDNCAIFVIAGKEIRKALENIQCPQIVLEYRRVLRPIKHKTRNLDMLSMGELNIVESIEANYNYFERVMAVMLGLYTPNAYLPNGQPDWNAGIIIDTKAIRRLQFIGAYRYFIEIQRQLTLIARAWKKLEMPREGARARVKRPNRGMQSICRQYSKLVGNTSPDEAWNTRWSVVYEAFESCKYDNLEQKAAIQANKARRR